MKLFRPTRALSLPVAAILLLLPAGNNTVLADPPARGRARTGDVPPAAAASPQEEFRGEEPVAPVRSGASGKTPARPIGNSNILHRQAVKKLIAGDVAGALENFDFALRISPDDASLYTDRGTARQRADDPKGAMEDWNRAIKLDPKNAVAYSNRGGARLDQGDTAGANADLLKAVELDRRSTSAYIQLANAENIQRDYMNAWADYRSACDYSERPPDYVQLAIYLIRARIGEGAAASSRLADYFKENGRTLANDWPAQIADYLLGKLSEADFVAAATPAPGAAEASQGTGRLCEASYYLGMKKLIARDKVGAARAFQECLATGQKWYVEYQFAATELKDLAAGK